MRGSKNAAKIIADMKTEEYFRKKLKRNTCIIDQEKQCIKCKYQDVCENKEN